MAEREDIKMQGSFSDMTPDKNFPQEGQQTEILDPLWLDIPDKDLADIIDDYEEGYDEFYGGSAYHLFDRRRKNEIYYFGRQTIDAEQERLLKDYESRYQDNVLYEIMGTIKPLGMSRVPDLMVVPGNTSDIATETATALSGMLDTEIKEQQNRFVLGLAYKHLPVYFTSVIKTWWNNEIDDYEFGVIHPDLIKVDWTCPLKDADQMKFVIQIVPLTVQEIAMRFPKSKEKFYKQLEDEGLMPGQKETWAALATVIKISEVWFHQYKQVSDGKVEKIHGLVWKYKDVILRKMKNPNFDYEGERRFFAFDDMDDKNTKRPLNENELAQILMTGQTPDNVTEEQVYHNYFRFPRKPYYFMGYDQWGKQPYDETSWIEQNITNQKSLDRRGKQIEETLDSRGHHILSKEAVTPAELEAIDFDAPSVDLSVSGKPSEVYSYIAPERPTPQEFEEIGNIRERMYAVAHSKAVRGEIEARAPATSNQIAREGDFTAADDMVEDTINPAAQWMADWAMQFIKLRYTQEHFRWGLGVAGDAIYEKLNRNMVVDGMIVKIKASGSDKLRAQNNAMEMAKMQLIDPYTFYVDMGLSDPEGRTEKLLLAKTNPMEYLQKVMKNIKTSKDLAMQLLEADMPGQDPNAQPNVMDAGALAPQPQGPQAPTPDNTQQVPTAPPMGAPQASPRNL